MKSIIKFICCAMLLIPASCDYLDVVPDQVATIDMAFSDRYTTERYLVTCYWGMPKSAGWNENPAFFGAMEVIFNKYLQTQGGMQFALGNASATNVRIDYWGGTGTMIRSLYAGIRECNTFMDGVMGVADLQTYEKNRMFNEAKLIKAYMHFYLLFYYGPICPLRESAPVNESTAGVRVYREKIDDCFAYVVQLIDEVIDSKTLPLSIINTSTELGRFTLPVAYYLKAKALTYWASPLYNGNTDYNAFFNHEGEPFFNQTFDASRWTDAAAACRRAVQVCDSAGIRLYQKEDYRIARELPEELLITQTLRSSVTELWNIELLWGNTSYMATGDRIQVRALPRFEQATSQSTDGNFSVPFSTVDMFYSNKGIPIDEDPDYDYTNRFGIRTGDEEHKYYIKKGEQTAAMNFDREPRFYSTLGFDRGIWYGNHYNNDPEDLSNVLFPKGRLNEFSSVFNYDSYNTTGYWTKKLASLSSIYRNPNEVFIQVYPWPDFRFADVLLLCAEALNESKAAPDAEVYQYIDMVRARAGLKGVVESWRQSINPDKATTKEGMRAIIQRERTIEFACEGIHHWDSHRWKTAVREQNRLIQGWNVTAADVNEYYTPTTYYTQKFSYRDYFAPIPETDIVKNPNLIQNPGW
ncbi:MAG: RagB/SusD family nutrient uptake outer membrane protein [Tannerella sp.]|nr:RagB/SusD family nutrient uptake outer membrane protein [Tannerella sp.]